MSAKTIHDVVRNVTRIHNEKLGDLAPLSSKDAGDIIANFFEGFAMADGETPREALKWLLLLADECRRTP